MIAALTGRLASKAPGSLIVDVAGVGYEVQVPLSTYYGLPEQGETVTLHVQTHLREDSLSLFGFLTHPEKDVFQVLLGVSGIGPRLALAVLSSLSVEDLVRSVQAADDSRLCSIPGVGKKTAARLILELKDRLKGPVTATPLSAGAALPGGELDDAVSALVNLGYKKALAEEVLRKVMRGRSGVTAEALIRDALSELMRK